MNAAWAARVVGAAGTLAVVAAGVGVWVLRAAAPASVAAAAEARPPSPTHADPAGVGGVSFAADFTRLGTASRDAARKDKLAVPRQVAPRVWGGRSAEDEARMRHGICPDEDDACRERARAELERSRADEP
jgi:hypothetical protein